MSTEVVVVPCLADNYAYLVHADDGTTLLIDAPEAGPIRDELERRGWRLSHILLTHHHHDHVGAVEALRAGAEVIGAAADAHRLPALDRAVADGDRLTLGPLEVEVMEVPGHTLGHIAFVLPAAQAAFTGDSLMVMGCGRLFEGTPEMMWRSLTRLAALPPETRIWSGHEYALGNVRFALTIEPGNPRLRERAAQIEADVAAGRPTVGAPLALELETNPFLRARLPEVKAAIGMPGASDVEAFAEIRRRKDAF